MQNDRATQIIQSVWRGHSYRTSSLPKSIQWLGKVTRETNIKISCANEDGRTNSCSDEKSIITKLQSRMGKRIYVPSARHWFDFAVKDNQYGCWHPVNIKSTTLKTADNTANLAMCVHALTNETLDVRKKYCSGKMAPILIDRCTRGEFTRLRHKDYYFLVINKTNPREVIVNSLKGLVEITPNLNNLPFQVKWCKNKRYVKQPVEDVWKRIVTAIQSPSPSWAETFLSDMRNISVEGHI